MLQEGTDNYELTGLSRGGEQLSKLKRKYYKAVELMVELASLQVMTATKLTTPFLKLDGLRLSSDRLRGIYYTYFVFKTNSICLVTAVDLLGSLKRSCSFRFQRKKQYR